MVYSETGQRLAEARVALNGNKISLFFYEYRMRDARYRGRVDFYDTQLGLVAAACELLVKRNPYYPETPEPWMAECKILDVRGKIQRQQDIRVKVSIPLRFRASQHESFSGVIQNLSAGGMYITTTQPLNKGEIVGFSYCFRTLERPFQAVILRIEKPEGGGYGYGCRFRGLTDGAEAAVRYYVFRKLEEKRAKERE